MSKKILSVALALIFVISTFAVSAFAVGGTAFEEDPEAYTQAWSLKDLTPEGETTNYSVGVYLDASYLVGAIQFQIVNEDGNAVLEGVDSELFAAPDFDVQYTEDGLVFIVPTPVDIAATAVDTAENKYLIATLSYTLKDGASSATLAIADDAKSETNPGGSLIAVRMSDDNLVTGTMIYGQSATVGEAITIGSAAAEPADLAKKAGAEAGIIIDTVHTFGGAYKGVVYGFTQGANNATTFMTNAYITKNLEATNGGTFELTRSIGTMGFGTGTVINVKNSDGTDACKYVVVIFGDVNGDGLINVNDIKPITAHISKKATFVANSVQMMAANCENSAIAALMHNANVNDIKPITTAIAKKGNIDQAALAAKMQGLSTNNYK